MVGFLVSFCCCSLFCFVLLLRVRGDTEKTVADGENVCLVNVSSVQEVFHVSSLPNPAKSLVRKNENEET